MSTKTNSKVIICKNIKIDRNYINVLNYTTTEMVNLCMSEGVMINYANDFSFLRTGEPIKVPFNYSQCEKAEYIAFQNPSYSNKWFFAWIDEIKWINENTTEIRYTIDSFSTFWKNVNIKPCFVVREHVADDTIGLHRVDENLDTGDYITDGEIEKPAGFDFNYNSGESFTLDYCVVIASNYDPYRKAQFNGVIMYNRNLFATPLYLFRSRSLALLLQNISVFLAKCNQDGHIEDVKEMFYVPAYALGEYELTEREIEATIVDGNKTSHTFTGHYFDFPESDSPLYSTELFTKRQTFSDYTPKNNKLKCYPYNFLQISNNAGNVKNYKFEDFDSPVSGKVQFRLDCSVTIGCSGRIYPMYYKGKDYNLNEQIPLCKYPVCNWSADSFTNWLTQQGVNDILFNQNVLNNAIVGGVTGFGAGGPFGAIGGAVFGAGSAIAGNVASSIGNIRKQNVEEEIVAGSNTADVNFLNGDNGFTGYRLRCRTENLKIIDSYFSRFGYKINETKIPNLSHRQNFNYVEIGSSECIGYGNEVPSKHMENINNAFRKGITIWTNHANLGNYTVSNNII